MSTHKGLIIAWRSVTHVWHCRNSSWHFPGKQADRASVSPWLLHACELMLPLPPHSPFLGRPTSFFCHVPCVVLEVQTGQQLLRRRNAQLASMPLVFPRAEVGLQEPCCFEGFGAA